MSTRLTNWLLALLAALCIAALGLQLDDVDAARAIDADRADAINSARVAGKE